MEKSKRSPREAPDRKLPSWPQRISRERPLEVPGEVPERHQRGPRRRTQRALERPCFGTSAGHKMYGFPWETCDSKNGKRARGMNTKHRVTALPSKLALCSLPSPLLPRIARTMIKEIIHASAARSLASLGSAQLAPRGAEELPEKPQREPRGNQKTTKQLPGEAPDSSQTTSPEAPKEGPEELPRGLPRGSIFGPLSQSCSGTHGQALSRPHMHSALDISALCPPPLNADFTRNACICLGLSLIHI